MNGPTVALIVISSANLLVTLGLAKALADGKKQVETEVAVVRARTNRSLHKIKTALEDLEV